MDYNPYILIIISFLNIFVVITKMIKKEKIKPGLLISFIGFFLVTCMLSYMKIIKIFNGNEIFEKGYFIYNVIVLIAFLVLVITDFKYCLIKNNHQNMFLKTLKESKNNIFFAINKNNRIIDISDGMCEELNVLRKDVIGKKFTTIINQTVRIVELNQNKMNNLQFESYFKDYKKNSKENNAEQKIELKLSNYNGVEIIFHLTVQGIYLFNKYKGYTAIGEKKTDWELLEVERKYKRNKHELETVQNKFISILEVMNEGLFEIDLDLKSIWVNDEVVKKLSLPDNSSDLLEFRTLINETDRTNYLIKIGELTKAQPYYSVTYRIFNGVNFIWVKETGKRIFDEYASNCIMGVITEVPTKHFKSSNIDVLDSLEGSNEMFIFMKKLFVDGKYFQLMLFDLANLKHINEEYGWDIGNMIMGEYIKKIKQNFVTESGNIFRITGTVFALILTNPHKVGLLEKGIKHQKDFLNYHMTYGSLNVILEVYAGIATSGTDATEENQIYQYALKALKLSKYENFDLQALYYKDING